MQDFPAFETVEGRTDLGLLILADHATNRLPPKYGDLGLDPSAFERHIAYDIGIEPLIRLLCERLGAPGVMSCYSRLLIDPNRGENDPTLIMKISDGAIVPGNYPLPPQEADFRLTHFHRPYHDAISGAIAAIENATGQAPLVISLHSFTPVWKTIVRPWHAGILWDADPRAARPLIDAIRALPGMICGDNEPYDGALYGDTMYRHCMRRGIPHALVEIRQDLIGDAQGVSDWADRLVPILRRLNDEPALHRYELHPSRTGPYEE
ncbi:MAG: N-formylglutamate amidohydrolase [Rhizobiaceae bacterium]|nr:N-formylglutamate amidohydrolase [Rhizobiaceae bacterium]